MNRDEFIKKIKLVPKEDLLEIIQEGKDFIKKDKTFKTMCEEYDLDVNVIDVIPMMFGDIDVSAKTNKGIIILNYNLLRDGDFFKDYSYMIHECQHYIQQCFNKQPTENKKNEDYLDNEYEKEAFQYQVEYIANNFGENEAEDYIENLLDHHDVESSDDREDKKEELMAKV